MPIDEVTTNSFLSLSSLNLHNRNFLFVTPLFGFSDAYLEERVEFIPRIRSRVFAVGATSVW